MSQVAESNLAEYLQKVDDMELDLSNKYKEEMQTWPVCLIQALDYLHEMKVKHKDLKPANILILKGQVLIADFGISKDMIDEETTASLGASGDVGTRMYCAPEVLSYNTHRGRAADIYAMGCIFLEISTVLIIGEGGLRKWSQRLEHSGSRLYSKCESETLRWIEYLFIVTNPWGLFIGEREIVGEAVAKMAFLMLDPTLELVLPLGR
jgi:serine/threonine protein kinase